MNNKLKTPNKKDLERLERREEIGERIWSTTATKEDIDFLISFTREEGELPSPRTMFLIGLAYHLGSGVELDHNEGNIYFNYVKEHGNGTICLELSHAYSEFGDEFAEESIECLEISAKKGNKLARGMLKEMKENPFILPKA